MMKKLFTLFACMLVAMTAAFAKEYVFDFSSKIPTGWTSDVTPNAFETASPARGAQFTKSAILTLKGVKNATKVVVTCSTNVDDKNSLAVAVGNSALGKKVTLNKENNVEKSFEGNALSGDLTLTITRSEKSVYIKSVKVTCDEAEGGDTGDDEKDDQNKKLDPNYTYSEPTSISKTGAVTSNSAYSFVSNNILVECTTGGQTADYFGCNAGCQITFTATQEIVAIAINGYVKKDFDAEASAGDLYFASSDEDYVEQDPVLYIEDINAKSVTIECVKQLRCYDVKFYFKEAPELDLDELFGGSGSWGDFTYEYEPTDKVNLELSFDEAYSELWTEPGDSIPMTDLYFTNDDFEMEVLLYSEINSLPLNQAVTFPIDTLYAKDHVATSIGYSDDLGAMPSYVITDFIEEDGEWYFNTIYHLISGTVTITNLGGSIKYEMKATTYNGSTIKASFSGVLQDETAISQLHATETKSQDKFILNGQLYIQHGTHRYNASGMVQK